MLLSATPTAGQQTWTSLLRDDEGAPRRCTFRDFDRRDYRRDRRSIRQDALGVLGGVVARVEFVSPLVWIFPEKNLVVQQHAV